MRELGRADAVCCMLYAVCPTCCSLKVNHLRSAVICCVTFVDIFLHFMYAVGALISPDRGRQEDPARPAASMQGRFSSAWQRAVAGLQQQRQQAHGNSGGPQQQSSDGAGPWAAHQPQPPVQVNPMAVPQAGPQLADVRPPGGFMRLLLSQGSQGSQPATSQPPVTQPAAAGGVAGMAQGAPSPSDGWRNVDMSAAYNAAYAQGLADRMRQQQQQQQQQQLLFQQQQQQLLNFLGVGRGVTPAPRPPAPSGPGPFAGENGQ